MEEVSCAYLYSDGDEHSKQKQPRSFLQDCRDEPKGSISHDVWGYRLVLHVEDSVVLVFGEVAFFDEVLVDICALFLEGVEVDFV